MDCRYLVRYGFMGEVGRFSAPSGCFERGQCVVIRSHRGMELGEILVEVAPTPSSDPSSADELTAVLRVATPEDLERNRRAAEGRSRHFRICQQVLQDADWPIDLIDVEPLLDEHRIVLHYLGPHHLELQGLLAVFRAEHQLEVMFAAVGLDVTAEEPQAEEVATCGTGGCGSGGGGCGSGSGGCGESKTGCSSCGLKDMLSQRRDLAHP